MTVKPAFASTELAGILITVGAAVIYGFYPAATRALYEHGGNAVFMTILSLFCRAGVLASFCLVSSKRFFANGADIKAGAINGFYQFAALGCILWAMTYLPGPVVVTIMFTYTTMLYLYMVAKGEEPYSLSTLATVGAALVGVSLVVGFFGAGGVHSLKGVLIAALSAVITAARIYNFGNAFKTRNPAVVGAETFAFAFAFSCALAVFAPVALPSDVTGWVWAGVSGLSLALGGMGALYGIALLGAFRFAFFIKLEPVFGALFAAVLIGEILAPIQYAGIGLVVGSLLVYQLLQKRVAA